MTKICTHSIHPTALATFAETTGGLALMSNLKKKDRAILVAIKMEVKSFLNGYTVYLFVYLYIHHIIVQEESTRAIDC